MRKIGLSAVFVTAMAMFGCGQNSDTVTLTLTPNLGSQKKIQSLEKSFFARVPQMEMFAFNPNVASCKQTQLFAGVKLGGEDDDNADILTYPIKLRTEVYTGSVSTFNVFDWLANHSIVDEPIQVSVPKGMNVEVGIIGSIAVPFDAFTGVAAPTVGADGICDPSSAGGLANTNYSLIGHRALSPTTSSSVSLNTWVLEANPPTPHSTPYPNGSGGLNPGGFYCPDATIKEQCSYRDIVELMSNDTAALQVVAVEYFIGKNRNQGVKQYLYSTANANYQFIPHVFPMILTYYENGSTLKSALIMDHGKHYLNATDATKYIDFHSLDSQ